MKETARNILNLLTFNRPLVTLISLLVSAIVYAIFFGLWFGIGLLVMLFIHEMGHIIAARIKGIETSGPIFIPFLGAVIFGIEFKDRETEAFVGYGGPFLGTIGAIGCFGLWFATGQTSVALFLASFLGVSLNLFNLIPISPLDGGRITQATGSLFKFVGIAVLLVITMFILQAQIILIWIIILASMGNVFWLWVRPLLLSILGLIMIFLMMPDINNSVWYFDMLSFFIATLLITRSWAVDYSWYINLKTNDKTDKKIQRITEELKEMDRNICEAESGGDDDLARKIILSQRIKEDELDALHEFQAKFDALYAPPKVVAYGSFANRVKWLVAYVALSLVALSAFVVQGSYLPEVLRKYSENFAPPAEEKVKDEGKKK